MVQRAPNTDGDILPEGAIIEFVQQGGYVKVSCADPRTLEEVSIVGDPQAGEQELARIVVRKLERVVQRKFGPARARRHGGALAVNRRADPPSGWDL